MTPEARLARLEKVAMLLVRAGYSARQRFREELKEHDRLINHAFDLQIVNEQKFAQNEERFAQNEERFSRNEERFVRNEERFVRNERRFAQLVESQVNTDRRLNSLIDIIKEGRNGGSTHEDEP